jgi:hypothetical protein
MARNALTVLKMSTVNSSSPGVLTMQAVDSDTGVYIDARNIDAGKILIAIRGLDSGANTSSSNRIKILDGDSNAAFSGYTLGNLKVAFASSGACTQPDSTTGTVAANIQFAGPIETSRFKDSDGYIKINTDQTACNIAALGAIFIGP